MDDAPQITITFGGRKYAGRRLTSDQILSVRSGRNDTGLMLDVLEELARSAFGEAGVREHLLARARGTATVEGFIKLMVAFMDECLKSINAESEAQEAPAPPAAGRPRGLDVAFPVHHGD